MGKRENMIVMNITDYLERTVQRFSERCAYEDGHGVICFRELHNRTRRIGSSLIRNQVGKGVIAVCMEKGVDMVTTFFGIAYSGNAYCPLDTGMPKDRLRLILDVLKPAALITVREWEDSCRDLGFPGKIFLLEELLDQEEEPELLDSVRKKCIDTDPLYVIFTSGSTGIPKGVVLPHRAVIDYMEWLTRRFSFSSEDILGNQAELYFDLSVQDVYAPIVCGCKTVFLEHELFFAPAELMGRVREKEISILVWAPSALCMIANLRGMEEYVPDQLRLVLFCGEVMPCKQLNYWISRLPGVTFVNLYGPTEAAVACTYYVVDQRFEDGDSLPIGIPCENTDVFVLNEKDCQAAEGEIGELCIRGSSLALGYYANPEKTEEIFVKNPLNPYYPEVIYRTGDLGYQGKDGNLMYVSRKDFQIKHLGFRIELGEIETVCGLQEGVVTCACVYDDKKKRIVLYYTGKEWENGKLKEAMANRLPHYMIPNRICHLEEMPYNRNGKIDRKVLKEWVGRR